MADRRSVRAELERKRIQLAQMRQERERRSRMLQENQENSTPDTDGSNANKLEDADAVLQALGLSAASLSRASTAPSNVSTLDHTRLSATSPDVSQLNQQHQQYSTSLNESLVSSQSISQPKTSLPLQVVHVNQIDIQPKERVSYDKTTQTVELDSDSPAGKLESSAPQNSYYGKHKSSNSANTTNAAQTTPINNRARTNSNQVVGANQLALEWDDEFPGMCR